MKKLLLLSLSLIIAVLAQSQSLELVPYATGFNSPVDVTHAGDDRLFVVEQGGRIKIIDGTGTVLATPFLNISSLTNSGGERGLLGLAFHPDYANNGYFFVNYTDQSGDTRVVRYSRSTNDPNIADPNSAMQVIFIDQTQGNHNGGCIKFGPDGYLYIGMGDGGGAGDQPNNSQNTNLLLGKMLRLDIDSETGYAIPADNPFVGNADIRDEIWAIGLRNPWRFSFDRETGDMWIGDVGQNAYEEIDFQPADSPGGENYGWRCYEADTPYNLGGCNGEYVFPAYTIPQTPGGPCSITGGFVYRGTAYPQLVGKYIFADFCSRDFFTIEPDGDGGWTGELIGEYPYSITSFGEGADGELYCTHYAGQILQVTFDACSNFSTSIEVTSDACAGEANGSAAVTTNGGNPPYSITPSLDFDNLAPGEYTLTITDNGGCSLEESFIISTSPVPGVTISATGNELIAPANFVSYQWLLNGEEIEGATSNTYLAMVSGDYAVMVTDMNGCSNTSDVVSFMVSDLDAPTSFQSLQLTPNPFTSDLTLSLALTTATDFELGLFSLDGKLVYEQSISATEQWSQALDLAYLPAGVYYLKLSTPDGAVMRKVVKQ